MMNPPKADFQNKNNPEKESITQSSQSRKVIPRRRNRGVKIKTAKVKKERKAEECFLKKREPRKEYITRSRKEVNSTE